MNTFRAEYKYSSTLSLTSALDWGGRSKPRPGRSTPGKDPGPILQEVEWAPNLLYTGMENLTCHGDSIPGPPKTSHKSLAKKNFSTLVIQIETLCAFFKEKFS
jgi:hypothetical protein